MIVAHTRNGDGGDRQYCKRRILPMIAILLLAIALGIVVAATTGVQHGSANAHPLGALHGVEHLDEFDGSPLQPFPLEIEHVWAARLMTENATDATGIRSGYLSGTDNQDRVGNLTPSEFTYDGDHYTVQALYYQRTPEGDHKLVMEADRPLPIGLFLHVGSDQYFGCEFVVLGSEGNTNVWTIARDLGWADGLASYAALFEPRVHKEQPIVECLAASAEIGSPE